jgi:hypothetical protein
MTDDAERMTPPKAHPRRTVARIATEGLLELVPGVSLLTKIYSVTHPPIEEVEHRKWVEEATTRSNNQDHELKKIIAEFLAFKGGITEGFKQLQGNIQHTDSAQQLSFIRGGLVTTLEDIATTGLTEDLAKQLKAKMDETEPEVQDIIEGLREAFENMSDKVANREFKDLLWETVFGTFGKIGIRKEINYLMYNCSPGSASQKQAAERICNLIDRFNHNLMRLGTKAAMSLAL